MEGMIRQLQGVVAAPPTLTRPAQVLNGPFSGGGFSGKGFLALLSPGVADPADPSHVTIHYEGSRYYGGGLIDVYLGDNDRLTFKTNPAPSSLPH
jgi:hypothetical protein